MNQRTVLIVDSQEINRIILAKILQDDYQIILAGSDAEALRILKTNSKRISAIILDLVINGKSGYDFLEKIHSTPEYAKIPVIVSSQRDTEEEEEHALACGANDYISKPYKPEIIKHRLRNTIDLTEAVKFVDIVSKDDVTSLYNKQYFLNNVKEIFSENSNSDFDIVCFDVEQFKMINDSYGLIVADKILCEIGKLLEDSVNKTGICARFNGDKFYAAVPHREDDYTPFIEQFTEKLNANVKKLGVKSNLKICCGIYYASDNAVPVNAMCDRAALAIDKIKGRYGKIVAYYDDEMRQKLYDHQLISDSMELALKKGEFKVFYQPKYELASKKIAGAEALVRWVKPLNEIMSPGDFIPLFEKNGFITQLDMFVWETACADIAEWVQKGHDPFAVSLNVSRADFYSRDLVKTFVELSDKYNIPRKYLHLEITESAYTDNPHEIIRIVTQLRSKGFPIEMDDFGSGYSSLNMLSEIPIDILKLDMGFVKNEMEKSSGKGILGFVISLAKWLNLAVVAEGVETESQISVLGSMECNYVQGFYFAKPLPKEEFFELLSNSDVKEMYLTSSSVTHIKHNELKIKKTNSNKLGTMLVVDDIDLSRAIIGDIFREDFDIVEAVNGQDAWNYIDEHSSEITIILMDLLMPVLDGFQLMKLIRGDERTKNIPIVVTSQGDEESEERALSMSADDFVSKPYNATVLKHRVKNVLANSKVQKLENERELNRELLEAERAVNTDALTGLYTRKVIESRVNDYFAQSKENGAVFIMIDVDNFKEVNDTYGHIKGDETLQQVAKILISSFRDQDVICRMGGDEYAVFLPKAFETIQLEAKLQRLCDALSFMVDKINVTCSIGACLAPMYGQDYQTLYNNADMALLASKRYGKNQFQIFSGQTVLPSYVFYRNMDWLLDEFNDAVIVCALDSSKILYINKNACSIAGKEKKDCMAKKCYEVMWGRKTPCPYCPKVSEKSEEFSEKEIIIDKTKYILRAKLISWGGAPARVQYIQKDLGEIEVDED